MIVILDPQAIPQLTELPGFLGAYLTSDRVQTLDRLHGTYTTHGCAAFTIASAAWVFKKLQESPEQPFSLPSSPEKLYSYYLKKSNVIADILSLFESMQALGFPHQRPGDTLHPVTGEALPSLGGAPTHSIFFGSPKCFT